MYHSNIMDHFSNRLFQINSQAVYGIPGMKPDVDGTNAYYGGMQWVTALFPEFS